MEILTYFYRSALIYMYMHNNKYVKYEECRRIILVMRFDIIYSSCSWMNWIWILFLISFILNSIKTKILKEEFSLTSRWINIYCFKVKAGIISKFRTKHYKSHHSKQWKSMVFLDWELNLIMYALCCIWINYFDTLFDS